MKDKIDNKLSKSYIRFMKTVNITLKAHKQIAKLNKQDMGGIMTPWNLWWDGRISWE